MPDPLRVLHILGELRPSGAEAMLRAAASRFKQCGVACEILGTGPTIGSYSPALQQCGYAIYHIPFSKSPLFFYRVYKLLRTRRYRAVHVHTERANFWLGLAVFAARVPRAIRTIHSAFSFTGALQWRRAIQRQVLCRMGMTHVAISASVRDREQQCSGILTQVVPNWYDSENFAPPTAGQRKAARAALGIADGEFVLVSVGNCAEVKNHRSIIEAISMLPATERPLYIHVGLESPSCPERLLTQTHKVGKWVRFMGPIAEVLPVLHAADGFVMPSLHEGFGVAAIEALGVGLPVILADVSGLRDFREDYPGIFFIPPTAAGVHAGIQGLRSLSSGARRTLSADYADISRKRFGLNTGVDSYVRLYSE